jgi:hypothetical protein
MNEPNKYEYVSDGYTARFINPKTGHAAPYGEYVRYEDYARLKAEVERLTKALAFSNILAKDLYGMLDLRMSKKDLIGIGFTKKQADEEWEAYRAAANATKEAKQP